MTVRPFFIVSLNLIVSIGLHPQPASSGTVFDLNSRDVRFIEKWRFRDGDLREWAEPDYPDADWPVVDPNRLAGLKEGVHWMRASIESAGEQDPDDVLILRFSQFPGAFEAYWDGSRVGENGRV